LQGWVIDFPEVSPVIVAVNDGRLLQVGRFAVLVGQVASGQTDQEEQRRREGDMPCGVVEDAALQS
jgi:hypothetical protein